MNQSRKGTVLYDVANVSRYSQYSDANQESRFGGFFFFISSNYVAKMFNTYFVAWLPLPTCQTLFNLAANPSS